MRKNQLQKAVLMVLAGSLIVGGAQAADDVVVDSNNNFIAGSNATVSDNTENSIVIGTDAKTVAGKPTGTISNAVVLGTGASTYGSGNVVIGAGAKSESVDGSSTNPSGSVAIGLNATITNSGAGITNPTNAIAIGRNSLVEKVNAIAIGDEAQALNQNNVSIGLQAGKGTTGYYNFALGSEVGQNIQGEENISIGRWANNNNPDSHNIAIGLNALNNQKQWTNTRVPISPVYSKGGNIALGSGALSGATSASNVALGTRAGLNMYGAGNVIMGTVAGANAGLNADNTTQGTALTNSIIMGTQAGNNAGGDQAVIIGNYQNNAVVASNVVAIGSNSKVTGQFGLGLGHAVYNNATYGLAVGSYTTLADTALHSGAFGTGTSSSRTTVSGASSYSIGNSNTVTADKAFVLGNSVTADVANSVTLGDSARVTAGSAIGTALLTSAGESGATTSAGDTGTVSSATVNGVTYSGFAGATANGAVSIGASGSERRLQNVAAGEISATSTDAINGSQLYQVATAASTAAKGAKTEVKSTDGTVSIVGKADDNDSHMVYDLSIDNAKVNLAYKANGGLAQSVSLANGLNFTNGTNTTATVAADGVVKYDLNKDITVDNITANTSITVGDKITINNGGIDMGDTKITNIGDGSITEGFKDAINGGQIYNIKQEIENKVTNSVKGAKTEVTSKNGSVTIGTSTGSNGQTIYDLSVDAGATNIAYKANGEDVQSVSLANGLDFQNGKNTTATVGADGKVTFDLNDSINVTNITATTITGDTINAKTINGDTIKAGDTVVINNNGIDMGGTKITNISSGDISKGSTDAVTGDQLFETNQKINNLSGSYNRLNDKVDKVGAGAAALAGLHPLDFNPDDKWSFAVGYGNYKSADAMAVGAYYQPNEDTLFGVAGSMGNGENMMNASVSFKIGQSSGVSRSRVAMAQEIIDLKTDNQDLRNQVNDLAAKVNQLLGVIQQGNAVTTPDTADRIRVDRISGEDNDRNKIDRVRVNDDINTK